MAMKTNLAVTIVASGLIQFALVCTAHYITAYGNDDGNLIDYCYVDHSGCAVWGVGLDRSETGSWFRIPLEPWMFVLVFLCCANLCR
jgi:hypothetical protein